MNTLHSTTIERFRKNQKNIQGPMVSKLEAKEDLEWSEIKKDLLILIAAVICFGGIMWALFFIIGILG